MSGPEVSDEGAPSIAEWGGPFSLLSLCSIHGGALFNGLCLVMNEDILCPGGEPSQLITPRPPSEEFPLILPLRTDTRTINLGPKQVKQCPPPSAPSIDASLNGMSVWVA